MKISEFSVHRPIFTTMVVLVVILLGVISLVELPIDLMPDVTSPTISISTEYENAGPQEVETLITRPIEEAISAAPGVEEVTSTSSEGRSIVRVTFAWGSDIDVGAADVRDRLDRVLGRLPPDADKPVLRKFDLSSIPVMILGVYGDLHPVEIRQLVEDQVKYRLERVPGVASLDIRGGLTREIHVNLHCDKIKSLGLSVDLVLAKIRAENVNIPGGVIERGNHDVLIRTPGEYTSLDEIRDTIITMRQGVPVRLKEVAEVKDAWPREQQIVKVNGKSGIRLALNKQSGTNTVEVAEAAKIEIEKINESMPQIRLVPIIDSSKFIGQSITNVSTSALYGGILAVIVLLAFLRNIRSTAIVATAIPVSIIATFSLMYFGGFTLNIMTLGGLALGVGMLVDNAIVVIENIFRLREQGLPAEKSAILGSSEVGTAVVASTLTTVVVFLPLVFVRGMAGIMFTQLAFVVGFSLLCSLAVALTFVPMLGAKLLQKPKTRAEMGAFAGALADFLDMTDDLYKSILHWSLNHRALVATAAVLLLVGCCALIPLVGAELMPKTDESQVNVTMEAEVGTRLEVLHEMGKRVEEIVTNSVPETEQSVFSVGAAGGGPSASAGNRGEMQLALVRQEQRNRSSEDIAEDLRKKLTGLPGMVIRTRAPASMMMRRMAGSSEPVQIEIRGHDLEIADELATRVKQVIEDVPGVTDVAVSRDSGSPEELLIIDRQKAATMKLNVSQIANMIQTVLSGTTACYYREAGKEYKIVVQMNNADQMSIDEILDLTLVNAENEPVVLRNVVGIRPSKGPMLIERKDQGRLVTITANITEERPLSSVISDVQEGLKSVPVPADFTISFSGDYEEQKKSQKELGFSMILAIILVYMVMACQFESLRDPFVVMFSVPFAIIGVVLLLMMTNTTFNVQSFIGCIMLAGIVVNNAIVLVEYINLLRRRDGMPLREAIEEAGRRRLRPILMTTLTTVLGLFPLALGAGEGGEAQAPMARAVIGGLISSTLITLIVVPVVYSIFEYKLHNQESNPETPKEAAAEEAYCKS